MEKLLEIFDKPLVAMFYIMTGAFLLFNNAYKTVEEHDNFMRAQVGRYVCIKQDTLQIVIADVMTSKYHLEDGSTIKNRRILKDPKITLYGKARKIKTEKERYSYN